MVNALSCLVEMRHEALLLDMLIAEERLCSRTRQRADSDDNMFFCLPSNVGTMDADIVIKVILTQNKGETKYTCICI